MGGSTPSQKALQDILVTRCALNLIVWPSDVLRACTGARPLPPRQFNTLSACGAGCSEGSGATAEGEQRGVEGRAVHVGVGVLGVV